MDDRSIAAQRLTRRFGQQVAVDAIDLEVPSGQIFAFLGPNGAGKTTVVKMLTTILAPTHGTARVAGHDVRREGHQVRLRIGVALQDVGVDPFMTAEEMLVLQSQLFGTNRSQARTQARELLRTVGLDPVSRAAVWEEVRRVQAGNGQRGHDPELRRPLGRSACPGGPRWRACPASWLAAGVAASGQGGPRLAVRGCPVGGRRPATSLPSRPGARIVGTPVRQLERRQ